MVESLCTSGLYEYLDQLTQWCSGFPNLPPPVLLPSGVAGSRKSPSVLGPNVVRGPRSEELPLAIPELPLERELKLDESPTTPTSTCSQQSKSTLTRK